MKRILFQGDSVTDVSRSRDNDAYPGHGYPTFIKGRLGVDRPGEFECLNRGISGNRVVDLYARIRKDFIMLKPDVISILIGINDVWHELGDRNGVEAGKFERVYDWLCTELEEALPGVKLVILEPFVLPGGATNPTDENPGRLEYFTTETALRAQAARRVAQKHGAVFVELQRSFDEACKKAPPSWWLIDGVHPSSCGHELIARRWIEETKEIL